MTVKEVIEELQKYKADLPVGRWTVPQSAQMGVQPYFARKFLKLKNIFADEIDSSGNSKSLLISMEFE